MALHVKQFYDTSFSSLEKYFSQKSYNVAQKQNIAIKCGLQLSITVASINYPLDASVVTSN